MTDKMDFMLLSMLLGCEKIENKEEIRRKLRESKSKIEISQTKKLTKINRKDLLHNGYVIPSPNRSKRAYLNDFSSSRPQFISTPKRTRISYFEESGYSSIRDSPIINRNNSEVPRPTSTARISPVASSPEVIVEDVKPSVANIARVREIQLPSIGTQTSPSLLNTSTQTDSDAFFLQRTVSENSTSDASTSTWFQMVELAKPIPVESDTEEIEIRDATTQTEIMEENSKKTFFGLF